MFLLPTLSVTSIYFLLTGYAAAGRLRKFSIEGHVTHGVNAFNSRRLVDFSTSSRIFDEAGPLHVVGVLDPHPKARNGSRITDDTPLTSEMATIDAWDAQEHLGLPKGAGPFNVPLAQTPTLHLLSKSVNDRLKPRPYIDSKEGYVVAGPYLSSDALGEISLSRWNAAASLLKGSCREDGTAESTVYIRHGLPNALYTMMDVGVIRPLTGNETLAIGPFGGLPNVITTDASGDGKATRKTMFCPLDKCKGAVRCTLYVSLFYHFDHAIYGASPALDFSGPAAGNVGSNHMQLFFNGDLLQEPQNRFLHASAVKSEL